MKPMKVVYVLRVNEKPSLRKSKEQIAIAEGGTGDIAVSSSINTLTRLRPQKGVLQYVL